MVQKHFFLKSDIFIMLIFYLQDMWLEFLIVTLVVRTEVLCASVILTSVPALEERQLSVPQTQYENHQAIPPSGNTVMITRYPRQVESGTSGVGNSFMDIITSPGVFLSSLMSDVSGIFRGTSETAEPSKNDQRPVRYKEIQPQINPHTGLPFQPLANPNDPLPHFLLEHQSLGENGHQFNQQNNQQAQQFSLGNQQFDFSPATQHQASKTRHVQPANTHFASLNNVRFIRSPHHSATKQTAQPLHYQYPTQYQAQIQRLQPTATFVPSTLANPYQSQQQLGNHAYSGHQQRAQEKLDGNQGHWTGSYSSHYKHMNQQSSEPTASYPAHEDPHRWQYQRSDPQTSSYAEERSDTFREPDQIEKNRAFLDFLSSQKKNLRTNFAAIDTQGGRNHGIPTETFRYGEGVGDRVSAAASGNYYSTARSTVPFKTGTTSGRKVRSKTRTNGNARQFYVSTNNVYPDPRIDKNMDPATSKNWETWGALVGKGSSRHSVEAKVKKGKLKYKRQTFSKSGNPKPHKLSISRPVAGTKGQLHPVAEVVDALRIVVDALENTESNEKIYLARKGQALAVITDNIPIESPKS